MNPLPSSPPLDLGIVNGHHVQAFPSRRLLIVDGAQVMACAPFEYQLAIHFLSHPGQPFRKDELGETVSRKTFRRAVTSLRKKFEALDMTLIHVQAYGYALVGLKLHSRGVIS